MKNLSKNLLETFLFFICLLLSLSCTGGRRRANADDLGGLQIFVVDQTRAEQERQDARQVAADDVIGRVGRIAVRAMRVVRMAAIDELADAVGEKELRRCEGR